MATNAGYRSGSRPSRVSFSLVDLFLSPSPQPFWPVLPPIMPGYVGLQLAVELTNILPVRQWAADGIKSMLDLARDLRKSGSDIVVEEDLADVLGRGRVSSSMEKAFKDVVKISKFTPLYTSRDGSTPEVELHSGPGPTVLRAFQDSRYFTTILTLSMLGYYHDRVSLAMKLSAVMDRRSEANIEGARPSPGFEGISATIESCSSQTSAFPWATLGQQVEARLQASMPDYHPSPNYYQLSTTVLLGAVDFFCRVQQLPLHRKVSISSEFGCIVIIIWAHHILDLTVAVTAENGEVVFGDAPEPHVHVLWTGTQSAPPDQRSLSLHVYGEANTEQYIQLMDKDATVNISCEPDESDRAPLQHLHSGAERHPLAGYCTTYLRRVLNTHDLTPDDDPIFKEAACLVTALAMITSRRLCRGGDDDTEYGNRSIRYHIEAWRIIKTAKMVFEGILLDETKVSQQIQYYTQNSLNAESLPPGFAAFLEKIPENPLHRSPATQLVETMGSMSIIVLMFSHISEIGGCSNVPIVMTDDYALRNLDKCFDTTSEFPLVLEPQEIFYGITNLLDVDSSDPGEHESFSQSKHNVCLYSSFGWTLHLSTIGDDDPSTLRPEIMHLRRGTPVNVRTKERKKLIRDGYCFIRHRYPDVYPWFRDSVMPKPAARLLSRAEYWTSLRHEFQAVSLLKMEPCEEWDSGVREIDGIYGYRQRQTDLWYVDVTPPCLCGSQGQGQGRSTSEELRQPQPLHLGPDTAALVGWFSDSESTDPDYPVTDRVIVLLTCGDRHLRWLALEGIHLNPITERMTMLRALKSCEKCALAHVESLEGKWILVL